MPNFFSDVDLVLVFFFWGGGGGIFFFSGCGMRVHESYSYSLPYIFRMWMVSLGKG